MQIKHYAIGGWMVGGYFDDFWGGKGQHYKNI